MKKAWLISFIRIPLLFVVLLLTFLFLLILGLEFHIPYLPELSTVYFTVANIISFYILKKTLKNEGRTIKDLIGKVNIKKDILLGFLWLYVLFIPFIFAVMSVMFIMYGSDFFNYFEVVFAGDSEIYSYYRPDWLMWFSAIVSLIFPFLNAPIEELMYRGYAQSKFIHHNKKVWLAILIPSIGFSLQHILLAASVQGAIVYSVAFFLWGLASGFIFYKQKRLMPLIICHFIVNLSFSVLPIILMITGGY